jgi:DNA-binding transcriptional MerR regulator
MEKSPDAFRTISEVADILETPAHVLRFWESRFPQVRPVKRAGGRRYYRPADVALLTGIKRLLHDEGMTIRGVQKILREQGVRYVSGMAEDTTVEEDDAALEAALVAAAGPVPDAPPLPPEEAESAQVIALEAAMAERQRAVEARAEAQPVEPPPILTEITDDPPARPVTAQVDLFGWAPSPVVEPPPATVAEAPEAPEAPMAIWAEEEEPTPPAPVPLPRIEAPPLEEAQEAMAPVHAEPPALPVSEYVSVPVVEDAMAARGDALTLAARLRATSAGALSPSDRATISLLRARARALRDRLAAPLRHFQ